MNGLRRERKANHREHRGKERTRRRRGCGRGIGVEARVSELPYVYFEVQLYRDYNAVFARRDESVLTNCVESTLVGAGVAAGAKDVGFLGFAVDVKREADLDKLCEA
jgi:hypothetical protein